jgi:hypothetical protein
LVTSSGPTFGNAGGGTGNSSSQSTGTSTSITALNPNSTSTNTTTTIVVVYVVPPPIVIHLNPSVTPVLAQSNSTQISIQEEQPPSLTHFGQGPQDQIPTPLLEPEVPDTRPASFLDFVEPFQPLPADGAAGDHALPPGTFKIQPMPGSTSATDFAVDSLFLGSWYDRSTGAEKPQSEDSGLSSASTLFGALVVAVGGCRLAIRETRGSLGRPFARTIPARSRRRGWPR